MAKKNFKGGLDSLIENSLGIKKSRKGEMKGNPVDFIKPEQTDDDDEVLAKPRTPKKPVQQPAATQPAAATPEIVTTPAEQSPAQTSEPTQTTAPAQTAAPAQTTAQAQTSVPVQTAAPAQTTTSAAPAPAETTAPAQTAAPAQTTTSTASAPAQNTVTVPAQTTTAPAQTSTAPALEVVETSSDATLDAFSIDDFDIDSKTDEPQQTEQPQQPAAEPIKVSLESSDDDSTTVAYLKEVIGDLRHELFLWRNGSINVQTFNATLHTHGLKYNPVNNEIEEFDAI